MIVIPPTAQFEEYFIAFAKKTWTQYMDREPSSENDMQTKHKTLVVTCSMVVNEEQLSLKLHYRFIRSDLYCFVEEI